MIQDKEKVIVIDFGGQYNQLVARRVRECNVYCEIYSYKTPLEKIKEMAPKGIILTGGPNSCYEEGAPTAGRELFEMGVPVLGLCYGAQLMMHVLGGKVERAERNDTSGYPSAFVSGYFAAVDGHRAVVYYGAAVRRRCVAADGSAVHYERTAVVNKNAAAIITGVVAYSSAVHIERA